MKNIVLYGCVTAWILLVPGFNSWAQKPAIDLLPSDHQMDHPEAALDTGSSSDSVFMSDPVPAENGGFYVNGEQIKTMNKGRTTRRHRKFNQKGRWFRKKPAHKADTAQKSVRSRRLIPVGIIIFNTVINP